MSALAGKAPLHPRRFRLTDRLDSPYLPSPPTMHKSSLFLALAITPVFLFASCGAPPGMTKLAQPLTNGPILGALFNPEKLTPETEAYLKQQDLLGAYRKDPSAMIISLRKGLTGSSPSQHRVALIELCSDQGDRLAKGEPHQAAGYHLAAAELAFPSAASSQSSARRDQFRAAYNHSAGQLTRILFDLQWRPSKNSINKTGSRPSGKCLPKKATTR